MGWTLLLVIHCHLLVLAQCVVDLSGKIYQTHAALEKENLMFCYECSTMVNGKSCSNFTDKEVYSKFSTKCTGDRKTCMVKRYSYTTSNESATSRPKLWWLERNCSGKCEDGCIVIGERTKIYACQACCETPLCNVSNGSGGRASDGSTAADCLRALLLLFLLLHGGGPLRGGVSRIATGTTMALARNDPQPRVQSANADETPRGQIEPRVDFPVPRE